LIAVNPPHGPLKHLFVCNDCYAYGNSFAFFTWDELNCHMSGECSNTIFSVSDIEDDDDDDMDYETVAAASYRKSSKVNSNSRKEQLHGYVCSNII